METQDPYTQEKFVIDLLKSTKTQEDWDDVCDDVKRGNGGDYPSFWYKAVIVSGLASEKGYRFQFQRGY